MNCLLLTIDWQLICSCSFNPNERQVQIKQKAHPVSLQKSPFVSGKLKLFPAFGGGAIREDLPERQAIRLTCILLLNVNFDLSKSVNCFADAIYFSFRVSFSKNTLHPPPCLIFGSRVHFYFQMSSAYGCYFCKKTFEMLCHLNHVSCNNL